MIKLTHWLDTVPLELFASELFLLLGTAWLTRGLWCWYMKSNEILARLE